MAVINKNHNIKQNLSDEMKIFYYYYYATRCPNWWSGCGCDVENCSTSDHYHRRDAEAVLRLAKAVDSVMDKILSQHGIKYTYPRNYGIHPLTLVLRFCIILCITLQLVFLLFFFRVFISVLFPWYRCWADFF